MALLLNMSKMTWVPLCRFTNFKPYPSKSWLESLDIFSISSVFYGYIMLYTFHILYINSHDLRHGHHEQKSAKAPVLPVQVTPKVLGTEMLKLALFVSSKEINDCRVLVSMRRSKVPGMAKHRTAGSPWHHGISWHHGITAPRLGRR
jgi:hypothetical protein